MYKNIKYNLIVRLLTTNTYILIYYTSNWFCDDISVAQFIVIDPHFRFHNVGVDVE